MKNEEYLRIIKDLLRKYITIEKTSEIQELFENYITIEQNINENIFNILNYERILFDVKIEKRESFNELIETLKILKNNSLITLTENQIDKIKNSEIFTYCLNTITDYKRKIEKRINDIEKINSKNKIITEIIEELNNLQDNIIDDELTNKIYTLIKEKNMLPNDSEEIIKSIIKYNTQIYEDKIEKTTNINPNILIELFNKYGYDYNKIPKSFQERFLLKSDLNNIEEIFITIQKYNIQLNEKNKSHLCLILKSDKEIIEKIWELSKKYKFSPIEAFKKIPGIFLHKNHDRTKINYNKDEAEFMLEIPGAFEDFEENIKLIEQLGYDPKEAMENTSSILIEQNTKLKRNAETLIKYGFPNNLNEAGFKLTGLKAENILLTIDKFIELGELKYAQDNTSRLSLDPNSYIFYRLYFAKKYNKKHPNKAYIIKREKDNKEIFKGIISDKNNKTLELDNIIDIESTKNYIFDKETTENINEYIKEQLKNDIKIIVDEQIKTLEEKFKNGIIYQFDDISISRNKVLIIYSIIKNKFNNLDEKNLLLYAITYNSILDHEDFYKIKQYIKSKEKTLWIIY